MSGRSSGHWRQPGSAPHPIPVALWWAVGDFSESGGELGRVCMIGSRLFGRRASGKWRVCRWTMRCRVYRAQLAEMRRSLGARSVGFVGSVRPTSRQLRRCWRVECRATAEKGQRALLVQHICPSASVSAPLTFARALAAVLSACTVLALSASFAWVVHRMCDNRAAWCVARAP